MFDTQGIWRIGMIVSIERIGRTRRIGSVERIGRIGSCRDFYALAGLLCHQGICTSSIESGRGHKVVMQ